MPATVVRPRWWTLPVAGLGSLVFVLVGAGMIAEGHVANVVFGGFAVLFFGGGFLLAAPRMWPGRRALVVDRDGLEIRQGDGALRVGWDEVEWLGVVSVNRAKMTAVRLRDPEAVAARMATSGLALRGLRSPAVVRSLMRAGRAIGGADLAFSWADRDRSADALLALFERYRAASI